MGYAVLGWYYAVAVPTNALRDERALHRCVPFMAYAMALALRNRCYAQLL